MHGLYHTYCLFYLGNAYCVLFSVRTESLYIKSLTWNLRTLFQIVKQLILNVWTLRQFARYVMHIEFSDIVWVKTVFRVLFVHILDSRAFCRDRPRHRWFKSVKYGYCITLTVTDYLSVVTWMPLDMAFALHETISLATEQSWRSMSLFFSAPCNASKCGVATR